MFSDVCFFPLRTLDRSFIAAVVRLKCRRWKTAFRIAAGPGLTCDWCHNCFTRNQAPLPNIQPNEVRCLFYIWGCTKSKYYLLSYYIMVIVVKFSNFEQWASSDFVPYLQLWLQIWEGKNLPSFNIQLVSELENSWENLSVLWSLESEWRVGIT